MGNLPGEGGNVTGTGNLHGPDRIALDLDDRSGVT